MSLTSTINVVVRVRRLERSRNMKVTQQLEALTDPTLLDRATRTRTDIALEQAGKIFQSFGVTVEEIKTPKRLTVRQYNQIVYSKRRDIIQ